MTDNSAVWTKHRLNELGFVGRGKSRHRPRNEPSLYGGQYPFFQTADIKEAELYLYKFNQTYNEKGLAQSKLWKPGTLCITIAANIAETAILKIEGCFPDSVVGFIPDKTKIDVRFVKYYIDTIKNKMQNVSRGTTQDNLSVEKILSFDLITPPLPTQQKIAATLSAYDDLIENNTRRIRILEEMAQAIYREWFVYFRFPGHEGVRMVESERGPVPEGWEITSLGKIATVTPGYAFRSKDWTTQGMPVIKIKNIQQGQLIDIENVDYIPNQLLAKVSKKYWLNHGDFLIAMTGATAGKVGKLRTNKQMLLNQRVAKINPRSGFREFLWCFISTPNSEKMVHALADGAAQPNMSGAQIENLKFIIPRSELIQRFDELITPINDSIDTLILINQNLRRTRDLLLPKLISGEIDVSGLNIQIPEAEA